MGWEVIPTVHERSLEVRYTGFVGIQVSFSSQMLLSAFHVFIFNPGTSLDFFICSFVSFVLIYLL